MSFKNIAKNLAIGISKTYSEFGKATMQADMLTDKKQKDAAVFYRDALKTRLDSEISEINQFIQVAQIKSKEKEGQKDRDAKFDQLRTEHGNRMKELESAQTDKLEQIEVTARLESIQKNIDATKTQLYWIQQEKIKFELSEKKADKDYVRQLDLYKEKLDVDLDNLEKEQGIKAPHEDARMQAKVDADLEASKELVGIKANADYQAVKFALQDMVDDGVISQEEMDARLEDYAERITQPTTSGSSSTDPKKQAGMDAITDYAGLANQEGLELLAPLEPQIIGGLQDIDRDIEARALANSIKADGDKLGKNTHARIMQRALEGKATQSGEYNSAIESYEILDGVRERYQKLQDKYKLLGTGRFASFIEWLKHAVNEKDPEVVEFEAYLDREIDRYRVAITGAAASEQEIKMLMERFPKFSDGYDRAMAKIKGGSELVRDMVTLKVGAATNKDYADHFESLYFGSEDADSEDKGKVKKQDLIDFLRGESDEEPTEPTEGDDPTEGSLNQNIDQEKSDEIIKGIEAMTDEEFDGLVNSIGDLPQAETKEEAVSMIEEAIAQATTEEEKNALQETLSYFGTTAKNVPGDVGQVAGELVQGITVLPAIAIPLAKEVGKFLKGYDRETENPDELFPILTSIAKYYPETYGGLDKVVEQFKNRPVQTILDLSLIHI